MSLSEKIRTDYLAQVVKKVEAWGDGDESIKKLQASSHKIASNMSAIHPGRNGCVVGVIKPGYEGAFSRMWEAGNDSAVKPESPNLLEHAAIDKHSAFAVGKAASVIMGVLSSSDENLALPEEVRLVIQDEKSKWDIPGGAIRVDDKVFVCSGYPEAGDDVMFILAMLVDSGCKTVAEARALAEKYKVGDFEQKLEQLVQ